MIAHTPGNWEDGKPVELISPTTMRSSFSLTGLFVDTDVEGDWRLTLRVEGVAAIEIHATGAGSFDGDLDTPALPAGIRITCSFAAKTPGVASVFVYADKAPACQCQQCREARKSYAADTHGAHERRALAAQKLVN